MLEIDVSIPNQKIARLGDLGWLGGHSRSLAVSPLSGHIRFLIVIRSSDRAILYRYQNIEWYYVKNHKTFLPTPI